MRKIICSCVLFISILALGLPSAMADRTTSELNKAFYDKYGPDVFRVAKKTLGTRRYQVVSESKFGLTGRKKKVADFNLNKRGGIDEDVFEKALGDTADFARDEDIFIPNPDDIPLDGPYSDVEPTVHVDDVTEFFKGREDSVTWDLTRRGEGTLNVVTGGGGVAELDVYDFRISKEGFEALEGMIEEEEGAESNEDDDEDNDDENDDQDDDKGKEEEGE